MALAHSIYYFVLAQPHVDDDLVVFAAKDWQSLTVIALSAMIFTAALFA